MPPVNPAMLHILLALAGGELHGYGIMQEILRQTDGSYKLGPGTLYDNLQRLLEQGWIAEVAGDSDRRRLYKLAAEGKDALDQEIARLEKIIRQAKGRLRAEGRT